MSNSHARRFVQSAWTLLSFQLIASAGAVAVTGFAAVQVQRMAAELESMRAGEMVTEAVEARPAPADHAAGAETDPLRPTEAPADPAARTDEPAAATAPAAAATEAAAAADPATASAPAEAAADPAAINACAGQSHGFRVQANGQWCDTGIQLQRGQRIRVSAQGTEALQAATIGRAGDFTFRIGASADVLVRANGSLQLRVDGSSGDGFVVVSMQSTPAP